jgi:hypothetical protein
VQFIVYRALSIDVDPVGYTVAHANTYTSIDQ